MQQWSIRRTLTTTVKRLKNIRNKNKIPPVFEKQTTRTQTHQHTIPPAPNPSPFRSSRVWRWGLWTLKTLNFLAACHLFGTHVFRISIMSGPSMLPTFGVNGEGAIEDFITKRISPSTLFTRGTLLTFHSPLDPDRYVCKRLIGLPGDIICVDPTGQYAPSDEHVVVPKGHVWVIGDNAAYSRDSRTYGPVPMGLVRGRIIARVWPPKHFTIFRNPTTYLGHEKLP